MGTCFCFGSSSATESPDANDELPELPPESPDTNGLRLQSLNLKRYSFADLKSMTRGFSSDAVIGEGRRSVVYTGWVEAETMAPSMYGFGIMVAVKKMYRAKAQTYPSERSVVYTRNDLQEILSELKYLRRLRHPNVKKLLGYCSTHAVLILVYEFMQKGSFDKHLFNNTDSSTASICWATRLRIAIGVARGLTFLHSLEVPVVHGGIDSSNILLDRSYNPKISPYRDSDPYWKLTIGYHVPGLLKTGKLDVKIDVYGFGIVLLQILTGLPAHDRNCPDGQKHLVDKAKPLISERAKLRSIMDARLECRYPIDAAFKAAQLALKCLRYISQTRPTMKEVLDDLERIERM